MTTLTTITTLYDYNFWANARLLRAAEALTPAQWDQPLGHSHGSVHHVLAHMLAADILWLARWQGESPRAVRRASEFPTLADVRRAWAEVEAEVRQFIDHCDEARLNRNLAYTNTRGEAHTIPLGLLMLHLANHGTHHRGELASMLTALQVPHPEDDLLFYLIEKEKSTGEARLHE